jgi:hypothetical protein
MMDKGRVEAVVGWQSKGRRGMVRGCMGGEQWGMKHI